MTQNNYIICKNIQKIFFFSKTQNFFFLTIFFLKNRVLNGTMVNQTLAEWFWWFMPVMLLQHVGHEYLSCLPTSIINMLHVLCRKSNNPAKMHLHSALAD